MLDLVPGTALISRDTVRIEVLGDPVRDPSIWWLAWGNSTRGRDPLIVVGGPPQRPGGTFSAAQLSFDSDSRWNLRVVQDDERFAGLFDGTTKWIDPA